MEKYSKEILKFKNELKKTGHRIVDIISIPNRSGKLVYHTHDRHCGTTAITTKVI